MFDLNENISLNPVALTEANDAAPKPAEPLWTPILGPVYLNTTQMTHKQLVLNLGWDTTAKDRLNAIAKNAKTVPNSYGMVPVRFERDGQAVMTNITTNSKRIALNGWGASYANSIHNSNNEHLNNCLTISETVINNVTHLFLDLTHDPTGPLINASRQTVRKLSFLPANPVPVVLPKIKLIIRRPIATTPPPPSPPPRPVILRVRRRKQANPVSGFPYDAITRMKEEYERQQAAEKLVAAALSSLKDVPILGRGGKRKARTPDRLTDCVDVYVVSNKRSKC